MSPARSLWTSELVVTQMPFVWARDAVSAKLPAIRLFGTHDQRIDVAEQATARLLPSVFLFSTMVLNSMREPAAVPARSERPPTVPFVSLPLRTMKLFVMSNFALPVIETPR